MIQMSHFLLLRAYKTNLASNSCQLGKFFFFSLSLNVSRLPTNVYIKPEKLNNYGQTAAATKCRTVDFCWALALFMSMANCLSPASCDELDDLTDYLLLPDRTFRNFRASKSGDGRILSSPEAPINEFWSSRIVICTAGLLCWLSTCLVSA